MPGEVLRISDELSGMVIDMQYHPRLATGWLTHLPSKLAAHVEAVLIEDEATYACTITNRATVMLREMGQWLFRVSASEAGTPETLGQAVLQQVAEHYQLA